MEGQIEAFTLLDNGIAPDKQANDGIYMGVFSNTSKGGSFNVEARATWVGTDGISRQRILTSSVTLKELDSDNDGISDTREVNAGLNPNDPTDAGRDNDNDGLDNWKEVNFGLDPFARDTDAGGLDDKQEICLGLDPQNDADDNKAIDSDGDGMPDVWETRFSLDPNDPNDAGQDLDDDGLTNRQEYKACTGPNVKDSDGDGINDGDEVEQGLDPNDPHNRTDIDAPTTEPPACETCVDKTNHFIWICFILLILVIVLLLILIKSRR